jgi:type III pantothenate kinase
MIGNSRLHWATFVGDKLQLAWDTQHLPECVVQKLANCTNLDDLPVEILFPHACTGGFTRNACEKTGNLVKPAPTTSNPLPLYLASVVPSQTEIWQAYPDVHLITLDQVPLQGVYPTLGIDRALALWGAGETWSYPILVIDAGTALTFTGADANRHLVGGAILPGLGLQLQSLAQKTANLPRVEAQNSLPTRWALNTPESIYSGVIYTIIAGMRDFIENWLQKFPESCVCLTGGDGKRLLVYLRSHPQIATKVIFDPHLIFWGMQSVRACGSEKGKRILEP